MPVSKSMEVGHTMFDKIWITRFLANHFLVDSPIKLENENGILQILLAIEQIEK